MSRDGNSFLRIREAPGQVENYFASSLQGEEHLSKPFMWTMRIRSQGEVPPVKEWIGASITFEMATSDATPRKINGQCVRFEQSYQKGSYVEFVIDIAPMFVRAKQRRDCRIFTKMSSIDIVEKILGEHRMAFDTKMVKSAKDVREYCVQYWETDFDFCSRLMEEDGIFYYFLYDPNAGFYEHKMHIADDKAAYFDGEIYQITFHEDETHQGLTSINLQHMQTTSAWMSHDYDYRKPKGLTPIKTSTRVDYAAKNTKFYEWPGGYDNMASGERISRFGMEHAEVASVMMTGVGTYMGFMPGARFEIIDKRLKPAERRIAIRSVHHTVHNPYNLQEGEFEYKQWFSAVPSYEPYHPPRITPRGVVKGPQTAVILDQTDPDGFGRVKVRFHWDHLLDSTCWLRVAQQWAGAGIGAQWIPRVGDEVLVTFLEGDPDRPVVTASLYNADNKHPFTLPEHLSQSGWRTKTHPKGDVVNAFVFEDKKGGEEIYTYAGRNYRREVVKDEDVDIHGHLKTHVGKTETRKVDDDHSLHVGGQQHTLIEKSAHVRVGQGLSVEIKNGVGEGGVFANHMLVEGPFTIESKTLLSLQVGANRIDITPAGIMINGALVTIN